MTKNQGRLFSSGIKHTQLIQPVANARKDEARILRRIIQSKNKAIVDRANLSPSWLPYGT